MTHSKSARSIHRYIAAGLMVVACCLPGAVVAAEGTSPWSPPDPSGDGWDWVQLDTGEWVKGDLLLLQNDEVLFDSDNFDEIRFDWDDVVVLRMADARKFRRKGRRTYVGVGELEDGVMRISTRKGEVVEFPQIELIGIVYPTESEFRNWRIHIGASLAARAGNSDQQDASVDASFVRNRSFTRWKTEYSGVFSRVDGERTTNNHRASSEFDYLVRNRFFIRIVSFEFFADEFQNIDGRYTPGSSLGYQLIDTRTVEQVFTLGAAAQITRFDGGRQEEDAALLFTSELSLDLPRDIDFDVDYNLQLVATDLGKTSHNASAVLSFDFWGPIDFDVGAHWDRIESPERDGDGDKPEKNDFRLTAGLSVEF